ncbi:hypothetical protein [Lysinibacillus irui]|uniref:Uncharacterized protein n=1 Tax=Lysinibacillus irui TaxID=2998077 RepID=A0AAJ5UVW4_9BACI|nr:hypothetical protein [Lysinibacillus irui]WDV09384.1 hypothetical protein OU989_22975 [Lysinibacillus irui]
MDKFSILLNVLSRFILLSCASILLVSMIGDLIGWLNISTDFPFGLIWFLSFWAALLNLMYQFYFKKIKLVAKRTALDFGIVTLQAYSFYGGITCTLIHFNLTI